MKKTLRLTSFLALLLLVACERSADEDFQGPSLDTLFGPFAVLEDFSTSSSEVDFSTGETMHFNALFSKQVKYEVHMTGLQSCAHKVVTGIANELDVSNSLWDGTTTDLPMFKAEPVAVRADIYDVSDSLLIQYFDTIQVNGTLQYDGVLVSDFENGLHPDWGSFLQSGADMRFFTNDEVKASEGDFYLDIAGDVPWDWLILLFDMPAESISDSIEYVTYPLAENANDVYFNCFMDIPETTGDKFLLFRFYEDDDGNGQYSASTDDYYLLRVDGLEAGWQHFSIQYNDLIDIDNGAPTGTGNGLKEPNNLLNIEVLMLAEPGSGFYQARLDYMIFTEGGPLVP